MTIINDLKNELASPNNMDRARTKADTLKAMTVGVYDQIVSSFNDGAMQFWASQDATPQEVADQLGINASGIFYLHARLGELAALIDPTAIQYGLNVIGTYDNNPDGSITITSVPTGVII
jgi:hypothetical protein